MHKQDFIDLLAAGFEMLDMAPRKRQGRLLIAAKQHSMHFLPAISVGAFWSSRGVGEYDYRLSLHPIPQD